ncbi:hypothetical protein [Streptomyces adustus]|uniref:hypothetical protein n=1 Tax=Streptomyces adustus TaxID=1609272 RepID=UPI003718D1EC
MITLHDVYERDSDEVKAAVLAFGALHVARAGSPDSEPDWKQAEKHFTLVIEEIMGAGAHPSVGTMDGRIRLVL